MLRWLRRWRARDDQHLVKRTEPVPSLDPIEYCLHSHFSTPKIDMTWRSMSTPCQRWTQGPQRHIAARFAIAQAYGYR
jgi:hypothetical protein